MFTRRDVVSLAWYGALFSAVVVWAAWRRSGEPAATSRGAARVSPTGTEPLERSDDQPEMRRVMQRMMTH